MLPRPTVSRRLQTISIQYCQPALWTRVTCRSRGSRLRRSQGRSRCSVADSDSGLSRSLRDAIASRTAMSADARKKSADAIKETAGRTAFTLHSALADSLRQSGNLSHDIRAMAVTSGMSSANPPPPGPETALARNGSRRVPGLVRSLPASRFPFPLPRMPPTLHARVHACMQGTDGHTRLASALRAPMARALHALRCPRRPAKVRLAPNGGGGRRGAEGCRGILPGQAGGWP